MDRGTGKLEQPKSAEALRTYEDCLSAIEKQVTAATGDVATLLSQLRDFMKSRIERSSAKSTPSRGEDADRDDGVKDRVAAYAARTRPVRIDRAKPLPSVTETTGGQDFGKGALD